MKSIPILFMARCNGCCLSEVGPQDFAVIVNVTHIGPRNRVQVIPFHQGCWDSMSNSSNRTIFTCDEWTDFAGTEWDMGGMVEFYNRGWAPDWMNQGEWVSMKDRERLAHVDKPLSIHPTDR